MVLLNLDSLKTWGKIYERTRKTKNKDVFGYPKCR
ncbi:MAG: hypothetical protein G01um101444_91 [Parcubacteria group bacterium Gr01-1014_44]|nr:MAG: hypothetical protein G01um101444_91 [Parcubacteria group bacterium Gr01-1014_44]